MTRSSEKKRADTLEQAAILSPELSAQFQDFHEVVLASQRILLSTHENPDGDGLGSQIAFYEHLLSLGKEVRILNCSKLPAIYQFLDPQGWYEVYEPDRDRSWLTTVDLAILFDLGDFRRLREVGQDLYANGIPLASIDHHPQSGFEVTGGKPPYTYFMLDYNAPSTGTLIWQYFRDYRTDPITSSMAHALYTALVTDTGSFRYDNTNELAHLMAVDLLRMGIKPYQIQKNVYEQRERSQVRLLGYLINNLKYSADGYVCYAALTDKSLKDAGSTLEDVDGFSDFIRTIKGVEVAVLVTEFKPGITKLNIRSKGTIAINDIALELGGGGHPFASGARVDQPWNQVLDRVLPRIAEKLEAAGLPSASGEHIHGS